jgi:hypothetical protein
VKAVSFDPDLLERAEAAAIAQGIGFSEWVRNAVASHLNGGATSLGKPSLMRPVVRAAPGEKRHAVTCTCGVCQGAK